jgi:hypothetical protein
MGNSPICLSVTHATLSAKRFGSYRISKIDFAVEFCFWTKQRLNETQLLGFGLAETPEVLNSITVGNSLIFPMVHKTAPNSQRIMSYGLRKLNWFAESEVEDRLHLLAQVRFLMTFHHDLPINFEYKICR